jgi:hypothetical protein
MFLSEKSSAAFHISLFKVSTFTHCQNSVPGDLLSYSSVGHAVIVSSHGAILDDARVMTHSSCQSINAILA